MSGKKLRVMLSDCTCVALRQPKLGGVVECAARGPTMPIASDMVLGVFPVFLFTL